MKTENFKRDMDNLELDLGPKMTFRRNVDDNTVIFTYGYGVIHSNDIRRIVGVCSIHGLEYEIKEREKCIDVEITNS